MAMALRCCCSTTTMLLLGLAIWSDGAAASKVDRLRLQICVCGEHRPNATMDLHDLAGGIVGFRFGFATFDKMVAAVASQVLAPPNSSLHVSSSGHLLRNFTEFDIAVANAVSMDQDVDGIVELLVTVVWPDRYWVWPAPSIGHFYELPNVPKPPGVNQSVLMTVLSTQPRLFYVENFISKEECDELVAGAQDNFKRSVTGISDSTTILTTRTSKTHWDQTSEVSLRVQDRALTMVGIPLDKRDRLDAVQVLKYGVGEEYRSHTDYFPKTEPKVGDQRSFDPQAEGGTNRFLTILMYLDDLRPEQGGGTAFPRSQNLDGNSKGLIVGETSVESNDLCTTAASPNHSLSCVKHSPPSSSGVCVATSEAGGQVVPAKKGTAVLFYSQQPDGELDPRTVHAGCPVLDGTKYAANVWVWNKQFVQKAFVNEADGKSMKISFFNTLNETVTVYWMDLSGNETKLADVGPEEKWISRTFEGHTFVTYNSHGRKIGLYTMDSNTPMVYIEDRYLEVWFENDLDTTVDIFWINLDAKDKPSVRMGFIYAGNSFKMNTFLKHMFEFEYMPQSGGTPERRKYVANSAMPRIKISELAISQPKRDRSEL